VAELMKELNRMLGIKTKLSTAFHPQMDGQTCYDLKLKGLSKETTLVLSNTRELDRVPSTEQSTLYTNTHGPC